MCTAVGDNGIRSLGGELFHQPLRAFAGGLPVLHIDVRALNVGMFLGDNPARTEKDRFGRRQELLPRHLMQMVGNNFDLNRFLGRVVANGLSQKQQAVETHVAETLVRIGNRQLLFPAGMTPQMNNRAG